MPTKRKQQDRERLLEVHARSRFPLVDLALDYCLIMGRLYL